MRTLFIHFSVLLFFITPSFSQDNAEQENGLNLRQVKDDIYIIKGKGGNVGFSAGKKTVLMVDTSFSEMTADILKEIKKISNKPIQYVINTHHHGDHTGGNENLANEGAIIIAQRNARENFLEVAKNGKTKIREIAIPTISFSEDITIQHNKESVMIFHVHNAHTDGDAVVFFTQSNVIHAGDVLFNGKYPYIDLENGGSVQGYIDGLKTILKLTNKDTIIIPGHGELATPTDVTKTINMLTFFWKQIAYQHGVGTTETEILANTDMTKKYDDLGYGDGLITTEKILKTIYDDVVNTSKDK